jgi:hypothetical protein
VRRYPLQPHRPRRLRPLKQRQKRLKRAGIAVSGCETDRGVRQSGIALSCYPP